MLRSKSSSSRARAASTSSRGSSSPRGRGRGVLNSSGNPPNAHTPNPFETERQENAAKREQRSQESTGIITRGARGTSRGRYQNKSVRFASPPIQPPKDSSTVNVSPFTTTNGTPSPFTNATPVTSSGAVTTSLTPFNPFAPAPNSVGTSPFSTSTNGTSWNPFSNTSSVQTLQTNSFGGSQITNGTQQSSILDTPLGVNPSLPAPNPFGNPTKPSSEERSIFGIKTSPNFSSNTATINPFSASKAPSSGNGSNPFSTATNTPSRRPQDNSQSPFSHASGRAPSTAGSFFNNPKNKLALEIENLLRKNGIIAPSWPTSSPGDPSQKASVETFWQNMKAYRAKVRTCLIRNGYLDDPDKPKKLSEAIDFKGICEDMCPEFEKITRIIEHDVQSAEKEPSPDGQTYWPAPHKMVKALARSAAGQDAPLPEDVRSPAALRRTLDYLVDIVLGTNDLPTVHGFLWDRTRAIRRDFVFQQSSMTSQELLDQVYCLEQITRFHVVALHQMSHEDVIAEDFSEQQEVEQLGKALLSLIHAYEDCMVQGIHCENEPEFRAYYVLFNSHNTGILEAVQDWGWKYWGGSDDIQTAVSLVETLQNIWDTHGPLKPHSATDIAPNAYHRFFLIVEDSRVSYTMACFAEIYFNKVRKAALKTILASYRKQRDQTTDWTLDRLNTYLHFDDENDIVTFGEAYGVHFDTLNGQECLSFESDDQMIDPFPQLKQPHSYKLVERKRGEHNLPDVIHHTVYETTEEAAEEDDSNSLFVSASSNSTVRKRLTLPQSTFTDTFPDPLDDPLIDDAPFPDQYTGKAVIQEDKAEMQAANNQYNFQAPAVSFSNLGSTKPATDSRVGEVGKFDRKASGSVESPPAGNTSIFENKSSVPQQGIFSFPDQKPPRPTSHSSPSSTPSFPPGGATQSTKTPSHSEPPSSNTLFSTLGSNGGLTISPSTPPPLTSTTNLEQLGSVSDTAKDATPRQIEPEKADKSMGEQKRQSTGGPESSHLERPGDRASVIGAPTKSRMAAFSDWVALGENGLIDQFTEAAVEKILMQTVKKYVADEKKRRLQEEERLSRKEAANFRFKFLATKYFYAWREIAHHLWLKRKGRLARQVRRQMAEESVRASQALEKRDIIEDFRASGGAKQQNIEQSLIHAEGRSFSDTGAKLIPRRPKKGKHLPNGDTPSPPGEKQSPDDILRKSLLSDSAYLQGGSRIHLIPSYKASMESRRQPNAVKTDYFRLKARGIMTLPDGTPLANTAAVHLNHKPSLDNISKALTPKRSIGKPFASSVPSKPVANNFSLSEAFVERDNDFEALKARARAIMAKDKEGKQKNKKRFLDDDDDEAELFANAKRIRDQMDEETLWMRAEIKKSMSRSSS